MLCIFFLIIIILKDLLFCTRDLDDNIKNNHHLWFTSKNLVELYKNVGLKYIVYAW